MAGKYSLFSLFSVFFLVAVANAQLEVVNGKIKISTVTTSGCGDTINFITTQLGPAYEEYKEFLDIEFVPWGRTVRNSDGSLRCQFGDNDCFANRLHRCTLDKLNGNQQAQVDYMRCEFATPYPSYLLQSYQCALAAGLNVDEIDLCVRTSAGDHLDVAAEVAAFEPMRIINFVPAIVFNDEIDIQRHIEARSNLKGLISSALKNFQDSGVFN